MIKHTYQETRISYSIEALCTYVKNNGRIIKEKQRSICIHLRPWKEELEDTYYELINKVIMERKISCKYIEDRINGY